MAWTASGLYYLTFRDVLSNTTAAELDVTTGKIALYNNTITPNFDTETAYAATGEVSGTGYTATGQVVVNPVFSVTSGTLNYGLDNQVWASPTTVTARGAKYYADAITTPVADPLWCGINFGSDFTSTAGTFTIAWSGGLVFTWDLTP